MLCNRSLLFISYLYVRFFISRPCKKALCYVANNGDNHRVIDRYTMLLLFISYTEVIVYSDIVVVIVINELRIYITGTNGQKY